MKNNDRWCTRGCMLCTIQPENPKSVRNDLWSISSRQRDQRLIYNRTSSSTSQTKRFFFGRLNDITAVRDRRSHDEGKIGVRGSSRRFRFHKCPHRPVRQHGRTHMRRPCAAIVRSIRRGTDMPTCWRRIVSCTGRLAHRHAGYRTRYHDQCSDGDLIRTVSLRRCLRAKH